MLVKFASLLILVGFGATNDACTDAIVIEGTGTFAFDSSAATTNGPLHSACARTEGSSGGDGIAHDVWYCWTAPDDGEVIIDTCRQTIVDTRLAVYAVCSCPTGDENLIQCNDEPPLNENGECGFQSRVMLMATAGQSYLVRLGSEPTVGGGTGTFTISYEPAAASSCSQPESNCEPRGLWTAYPSDGVTRIAADDFATVSDGEITELCWWGAYVDETIECSPSDSDAFEVTYFIDVGGLPGAVFAGPFRQADGSLTIVGPTPTLKRLMDAFREYEHHATHAPVVVAGGVRYWVQIVNLRNGACGWRWEASNSHRGVALINDPSQGGFSALDLVPEGLALCLNLPKQSPEEIRPIPENDACENALPIEEGLTFFDTSTAMGDTDHQPNYYVCEWNHECCNLLGDAMIHRDIWYTYTPPCDGLLRIEMCETPFDAKIGLFQYASCPFYSGWLACSDDDCAGPSFFQPQLDVFVEGGQPLLLQVGGYQSYDDDLLAGSDCFVSHPREAGGGCIDTACMDAVCNNGMSPRPLCCDSQWDYNCAALARDECSGHGGPGSIYLDFAPPPREDESLKTYTEFLACFSGSCSAEVCEPPVYPEPCCLVKDYDEDGDVDAVDYSLFLMGLTGPD